MGLVDDALRARLGRLDQFVHGNLLFGVLPRLLREDRRLFLRVL